jgi:hypothetical protein
MKIGKSGIETTPRNWEFIKADRTQPAHFSFVDRKYYRRNQLIWNNYDFDSQRFRINFYRFLRDNIPLLNACIWTWSRLAAAPVSYEIIEVSSEKERKEAEKAIEDLTRRLHPFDFQKTGGLGSFLPFFFNSVYTDGAFAGFLRLSANADGIDGFYAIDPALLTAKRDRDDAPRLYLQTDAGEIEIGGDDFYYFGLNPDIRSGLGKSILAAVPFVSYIEQQLIDDMRRSSHNAGYHRLHVKIAPPEKQSGETDEAYIARINDYFDETVSMARGFEPEDNPVTWDNVKIEYIGPNNNRGVGNAWFFNHRAMVEEICAGTNLAPFMLGYSYGATHNWAQFKYDLAMRQVISVQRQTSRFLEWVGDIELALRGFNCRCRFSFDNALTFLASEKSEIEKSQVDNIVKLYAAGLISKEKAEEAASKAIAL